MRKEWRRVVGATVLTAVLSSCAEPQAPTPGVAAGAPSLAPSGERSVCPGSVPHAGTNLEAAVADVIERLGGLYQDQPGVLGVVWDGRQGVVVVEAGQLDAWQLRLAPRGIAVAPSCVDPALLRTVQAALPGITVPNGAIISAGYDGLDDAISVSGIKTEVLLDAIEAIQPGARAAALAAIADGTLRISEQAVQLTR